MLLRPDELEAMWLLRKVMGSMGTMETLELVLERLSSTANNKELLPLILQSKFADNVRNK